MSATMIRTVISRPATMGAIRSISNSSKASSPATLTHTASESAPLSAASTAKTVAYTVLGASAVVGGLSALLKDEVIYWTPNARK